VCHLLRDQGISRSKAWRYRNTYAIRITCVRLGPVNALATSAINAGMPETVLNGRTPSGVHHPALVATTAATPQQIGGVVHPRSAEPEHQVDETAPVALSRRARKRLEGQAWRDQKRRERQIRREQKLQTKRTKTGSFAQNALTSIATAIAMAASSTGMWKLFGDVLHIDNLWVRASLFAVFEIALLSSALRARAYRIEFGTSSIDDKAVWAIATTTGVLASLDEVTWAGRAIRVALPLVAAFLFERLITTERRKKEEVEGGLAKKRINWRVSPHRIMVALGLADSTDRDVADVDLTRRMAKLATLAYRAHNAADWRRDWAKSRYQSALAKTNERFGLSTNPKAVDMFRSSLALLNGAMSATTAEAVETASPWARATIREQRDLSSGTRRSAASAPPPRTRVTADVDTVRPHNPNRDREVIKSPTKTGKSAEENWALIGQHLEISPDASRTELASVLGISRTRVGQIFDQFAPKTN
jgi:hypothetical protein